MSCARYLLPLLLVGCSAPEGGPDDTVDEASALFGPENRWFHAEADDVPAGLAGTGTGVGDVAYDFTLLDQDGNEVQLYQFYGQIIQLVLFAAWCGPCNEEAPELEAASRDLTDDGVVVLSVMMEDVTGAAPENAALLAWADTYDVTHPLLSGPGELGASIQGGYPTLPIIGRDMTIQTLDNYPFDPETLAELAAR